MLLTPSTPGIRPVQPAGPFIRLVLFALCALAGSTGAVGAAILDGLPGEEVVSEPRPRATAPLRPVVPVDSVTGMNWMAPPVHEQLARDPVLGALGKGTLFVPTFSESRREPDIAVFGAEGDLVATGQTGHRIQLDSGHYEIRFGSGVSARRLRAAVHIVEGRTTTVEPTWGGLLVETLNKTGEYRDGQYDLIRMGDWVNYGRGQGYTEERLQDIDVWILEPGLYRISRVGEGYNSLINYITVQINAGELHSVEIVFDEDNNDNLIAGGIKSLNTRTRVGQYWTYGLRAGGNASFIRDISEADLATQSVLFSTDMRLRARYDRASFFGITELFLQNSFLKQDDQPLRPTQDFLQLRSTWVRRLNNWIGPYVRGQASTHLFPAEVNLDTVYIVNGAVVDTVATGGAFEWQPSLFPLELAQGVGVNVEWLSQYEVELSTQLGLAARQQISSGNYLPRSSPANSYELAPSLYDIGAEGVLNAKLRLSSQFTVDLRAEIFSEDAKVQNFKLENLEADFRFFLIRNIEIGYLFQMEQVDNVANRFPRTHSVSLRLNFNY